MKFFISICLASLSWIFAQSTLNHDNKLIHSHAKYFFDYAYKKFKSEQVSKHYDFTINNNVDRQSTLYLESINKKPHYHQDESITELARKFMDEMKLEYSNWKKCERCYFEIGSSKLHYGFYFNIGIHKGSDNYYKDKSAYLYKDTKVKKEEKLYYYKVLTCNNQAPYFGMINQKHDAFWFPFGLIISAIIVFFLFLPAYIMIYYHFKLKAVNNLSTDVNQSVYSTSDKCNLDINHNQIQ